MDGAELPTGAHHGENIQGGAQKGEVLHFLPSLRVSTPRYFSLHFKIHSLNSQTEAHFYFSVYLSRDFCISLLIPYFAFSLQRDRRQGD